jgi:hypothetical protein
VLIDPGDEEIERWVELRRVAAEEKKHPAEAVAGDVIKGADLIGVERVPEEAEPEGRSDDQAQHQPSEDQLAAGPRLPLTAPRHGGTIAPAP